MNSDLIKELKEKSDAKFADFNRKLIPTVPREKILGVKIPELRTIAKNMAKTVDWKDFLKEEHFYLEEFFIYGFLLGYGTFSSVEEFISEIENFLPAIDNWAVCDCTVSGLKRIKKHYEVFYEKAKEWLTSKNPFTVRFAIVMLLDYYLENDTFDAKILDMISAISSEEYYVNIAAAWFFSIALIKQYDETIKYFEERKIADEWIHNKAIQKATESYRIANETKEYLRTLKVATVKKKR